MQTASQPQIGRLPPVLILDLDDTIIEDSGTGAVERCWRATCVQRAAPLGIDPEALYQAIAACATRYWADPERHRLGRADLRAASASIVDQALRTLGVADPAFARSISDTYRDHRDAGLRLFPGVIDSLAAFIARGTRLALFTNGAAADQRRKIVRFGLAPYFAHIQIEGEFGLGKPDPRVYQHTLATLAAAPADAWMVGDNLEWDVAAPQRLGIRGVWLDVVARTGLPPSTTVRPDHIITTLAALL